MQASEVPSDRGTADDPGALAPAVDAVIDRWNPQGGALLRAMAEAGEGTSITFYAADDANTTLLRTELARFEPHIDLADPAALTPRTNPPRPSSSSTRAVSSAPTCSP